MRRLGRCVGVMETLRRGRQIVARPLALDLDRDGSCRSQEHCASPGPGKYNGNHGTRSIQMEHMHSLEHGAHSG
jgi:hypothetical protein